MDLSIIIINYNSRAVLDDCLESIIQSNFKFNFEVVIVDNNSSESIKQLENKYSNYTFIYNPINSGFAAGNNIGIKRSTGRNILLLNPDTIVNEDSFDSMISYLDSHEDVGVVGCKIFNKNGELEHSTHSFPNLIKEFFHGNEFIKNFVKYEGTVARFFRTIVKFKSFDSYWNHDSVREVDHVTGACMMLKRNVVNQVGLLDESFFLYTEEVEWSYRIRKAGYKSIFLPQSSIIHLFGYSTKQRVQKQTINWLLVERYRGMLYFFQKHYGFLKTFIFKAIIFQSFVFRYLGNLAASLFIPTSNNNEAKEKRKHIKQIIKLVFTNKYEWRNNL